MHFSTEELPEADRIAFVRDVVGRQMLRLELEPFSEGPFRVDARMQAFHDFELLHATCPAVRVRRTTQLASDGNDNLIFQWTDSPGHYAHLGREFSLCPGDAVLLSSADPFSITVPSSYRLVTASIPRKRLAGFLSNSDACLGRAIPAEIPELGLLLGYLDLLPNSIPMTGSGSQRLAIDHVYDVLSLVLGATGNAARTARRRGLRAARLMAVKNSIRESPAGSRLSLRDIAARHGVTERYIQMLFEDEGTTYSEFVCEERLQSARRMLVSPQPSDRKIADIAYACGFGDISYFNRKFRTRFGASPREFRQGSTTLSKYRPEVRDPS